VNSSDIEKPLAAAGGFLLPSNLGKKTHNCRRRTEVRCVVEKSIAFFGEE
jgi:hypothetical protein